MATDPPPHETPFRYDDALLSSCASSPLARPFRSGGDDGGNDSPPSSSSSSSRGHNGDCRALFEAHAAHYRRPRLSPEEEKIFRDEFALAVADDDEASGGAAVDDVAGSPRAEAFLRSVAFVHEHNDDDDDGGGGGGTRHRVALNRFSDLRSRDLPLMSRDDVSGGGESSVFGRGGGGGGGVGSDFRPLEATLDNLLPSHAAPFRTNKPGTDSEGRGNNDHPAFLPLEDDDAIMKFAEKLRRSERRRNDDPLLPVAGSGSERLLRTISDSWWWIGGDHRRAVVRRRRHPSSQRQRTALSRHGPRGPSGIGEDPFLSGAEEEMEDERDGIDGDDSGVDEWAERLDWATEDNPDGVSVVHRPMDQGTCGSCWAISALGTLEASIARNMAYSAYEEAFVSVPSSSAAADPQEFAMIHARSVERRSVAAADLSVQELVDCDTHYDQGCAGGNPLLAFYFLHRFGVTSSERYPYTGTMNACQYEKADPPIASVAKWGILTPDHENNMEKVLRYIGPVAVGLIGADPAFLSYSGGVFTSSKGGKCDSGHADHAMLITGYGEETLKDGTVQKYWIARNSWGTGWGENGYVRMARSGGKKGHRGVCGIARSPSVALGGMFTEDAELERNDLYGRTRVGERADRGGHSDDSTIARASSQIQSVIHRIRTRLGFAQKGIAMSTNDGNENRNAGARALPCATTLAALLFCLLSARKYLDRRRGGRRRGSSGVQRRPSGGEESVATTDWSTAGVHEGVRESTGRGSGSPTGLDDGERTHLLANGSGPLLYT